MTPEIYNQIVDSLKREPLPLSQVYLLARDAGSLWPEAQIELYLKCMNGIEVVSGSDGTPLVRSGQLTLQEELMAAIIDVVHSQANKPIPAAEVKRKLPNKFTTTEEQIKSLARKSTDLEVFGPGLIRVKKN